MSKNKSNAPKVIIISLVIILVAVVACIFGYKYVTDDINGNRGEKIEYHLEITKQDFEYEIGQKLKNNHIVKSDIVWTNWMSKNYPKFVYINGEYDLDSTMSYEEIAQKLQAPDVSHQSVKVVIPEGFNCMEIAERLEEKGVCKASDFLEVCKDSSQFDYDFLASIPDNNLIAYKLEGFLFPATYDFALNSEASDVAGEMLETFDYHITDDMKTYCENNNVTMFELVNLASVVQEEALGNKSAENIASVFVNRLKKGDKLQSDVTYFYGAKLRDEYGFSQEVYDAYYTYRCDGLPAGPITNSGDAIVKAVVNHPDTDYYYFFSDLNQEFHFAKTYEEFSDLQIKYPWK